MIPALESRLRKRFVRLHGEGAAHQSDVYKCVTCGALVTWKKIRSADLCCQGHVVPTNPTWMQTLRLVLFP